MINFWNFTFAFNRGKILTTRSEYSKLTFDVESFCAVNTKNEKHKMNQEIGANITGYLKKVFYKF